MISYCSLVERKSQYSSLSTLFSTKTIKIIILYLVMCARVIYGEQYIRGNTSLKFVERSYIGTDKL